MTREEKIYEVASKNAMGELTPVQYKWWLSKLETNPEECHAIYYQKGKEYTYKLMRDGLFAVSFMTLLFLSVWVCL